MPSAPAILLVRWAGNDLCLIDRSLIAKTQLVYVYFFIFYVFVFVFKSQSS